VDVESAALVDLNLDDVAYAGGLLVGHRFGGQDRQVVHDRLGAGHLDVVEERVNGDVVEELRQVCGPV